MHEVITRVVLLTTIIAFVSWIGFTGYQMSTKVTIASEGVMQIKSQEIGVALSKNESGIVNGLSTGGLLMTLTELEPFNVTLVLPGGGQNLQLKKTAFCIVGGVINEPPGGNFSTAIMGSGRSVEVTEGRGFVRLLNGECDGVQGAFIMPVLGISYASSIVDQNVTVHSVRLFLSHLDGYMSTSGTFDLLLLRTHCDTRHYARYAVVPSDVEVFVDGQLAIEFQVSAGEKVTVDLVCSHSLPVVLR